MGPGLKHHLGAIDLGAKIYSAELGARNYGAKLGARIYGATGAEQPTMSPPRLLRAQELDASNDGVELRV